MLINQYQRLSKSFFAIIITLLMSCQMPMAATDKESFTRETTLAKRITPDMALALLKAGNARFVNGRTKAERQLPSPEFAAKRQDPFASIVSCIDSRVPPEIIFDQEIGDLFISRVAGNFVNNDILGGLEFGSKQYDSKLIVIMGHTRCGAVAGACAGVVQGFLTDTLANITPAVQTILQSGSELKCDHDSFVNKIAEKNVKLNMEKLLDRDRILRSYVKEKKIKLVGAMYNITDGKVRFLDPQ